MTIIFFDDNSRETLLPLTYTRPTADLRIGILKISEKWCQHFKVDISYQTASYLQKKFPMVNDHDQLFINGSICPNAELVSAIYSLKDGDVLVKGETCIAAKINHDKLNSEDLSNHHKIKFEQDFTKINYPEDIFKYNDIELRTDFKLLTKNRVSQKLSASNTVIGDDIFVEEGVEAECCTFNTKYGPIYLGNNSQVWEGSHIRGGLALCNDSQIKLGAKIYGATTIGPNCRIGGEINNVVIWGNSSKGHDGYLGNAVVGEWCNFGADTNNSNLKNNYAEVKLWDYKTERFRKTGLQFCGLIMADHAKCGINTMFNTGTVVGVGANVFGAGFPRNFIPDFSWGGAQGLETYTINKMFETSQKVYDRKNKEFNDIEKDILTEIFDQTNKYRRF
ncbi:glucose-1-phosphate thymidylyltransferase [Pedobacter sp. SD-b]|uniref:Glucose-1-phosphate thymidylyltransferase n=1 Tax=Pedobacter segetis TaxID=2793069 RepID=A0ABS1BFI8_9SPHI|nr:putative sugar nucleotidyl transferase [Pedobacter segetis]MBK0381620.1 glucose-1-phosphate thymidylyltransferase [Pedobacter segetis]